MVVVTDLMNRFLVVLCLVVFVLAKSDVVVIGHRGHGCSMFSCSSWLPENSIPAFLQGRAEGADRVELDTWLTADGKIIVAHGGQPSSHGDLVDSVVAPSGSTPRLEDSTLDVLRKSIERVPQKLYDSDNYRTPYSPALRLPLLSDVFAAVCPTGAKIQVEMKGNNPALGPAIIALARQMGVLNCIHGLSSFYWGTYNGPIAADLFLPIVNNTPLPIFLLFNNNGLPLPSADDTVAAVRQYNASGIHLRFDAFDEPEKTSIVDRARQEGFTIMSWTPGSRTDTEEELRHIIAKGVKEICTNQPGLLRRIVDEL